MSLKGRGDVSLEGRGDVSLEGKERGAVMLCELRLQEGNLGVLRDQHLLPLLLLVLQLLKLVFQHCLLLLQHCVLLFQILQCLLRLLQLLPPSCCGAQQHPCLFDVTYGFRQG